MKIRDNRTNKQPLVRPSETKPGTLLEMVPSDGIHDGVYLKTALGLINLSNSAATYTTNDSPTWRVFQPGESVTLIQE